MSCPPPQNGTENRTDASRSEATKCGYVHKLTNLLLLIQVRGWAREPKIYRPIDPQHDMT